MNEVGYMLLAMELAKKGFGLTSPNPVVGSVVVKEGRIVGKGYHKKIGEKHAEVVALEDAGEKAKGATLYTNLEPCAHFGRTSPCTDDILRYGIKDVVCSIKDPNPIVNGKGIEALQKAGVRVRVGLLEEQAKKLNEGYLKYIETGLPFVTLKAAITLDGKIATSSGESRWLSSPPSRKFAHELRRRSDLIIVGIKTVLSDNPKLTVRLVPSGGRNPVRMILDSSLKIPISSSVINEADKAKTVIVTVSKLLNNRQNILKKKVRKLIEKGIEIWGIKEDRKGRIDLVSLIHKLGRENIVNVLIEGGSEVFASALKAGIVDKVVVVVTPIILGGTQIPMVGNMGIERLSDALRLRRLYSERSGKDILIEGYIS